MSATSSSFAESRSPSRFRSSSSCACCRQSARSSRHSRETGIVCHRIRDDKGAETFKSLVGKYKGTIVCDALKTHEAGARDGPDILLAACWAHVYRKFEEAEPDHPEANLAMGWIGELYAIDERAGEDVALRLELRRTESAPVLAKLKTWLWSQAILKTLSIGKAAAYTIANWERLSRFIDNPLVPLGRVGHWRGGVDCGE